MTNAPLSRRWTALFGALALAIAGVIGAVPAAADTMPVDPATPVTLAADGLPTVQIDGVVWSQVTVGNTVYVAGSFQNARPAGSAPGVNTVARHNLLAYDIRTGVLIPGFAPDLNGQALGVTASPDGKRVYVVGDFSKVNGQWRVRVAAFDTATGTLVPGFRPTLASQGRAVAATNSTVYVGGNFTSAASVTGGALVPRQHVAAFNASDGALTSMVADTDDAVNALAMTVDGGKLVVGGRFTTLSGATAVGLGAVDPTTGAPSSFGANQYIHASGSAAAILSLYADETGVYGTAYHFGAGGNLEGPFRADPVTGDLVWVADCHGDTYSAFPLGDAVYTASHQHYCGNIPDGFPQTTPWTFHFATAFSIEPTGVNTPDIYGYPDHPGQPAPSLLTWYPQVYSGTYTGQGQAGWSVSGNDDYISYGGEFPGVNGQPQQGLVRFAKTEVAPNKQGPRISGSAYNPRATSLATGTVRVAWSGNWDRDNETLTYSLYRGSQNNPPIYEQTKTAKEWQLPQMGFTDTGLTPGSKQQYRIVARDAFGNLGRSDWVQVTVANSGTVSDYATAVLDDFPNSYWRLGEDSGSEVFDWAGFDDAVAGSGVSRGVAGAIADDTNKASAFDGTGAAVASTQTAIQGPDTFTAEAWIRTTTTQGGKILGFGNASSGESSGYDRHVYMDDSGRLFFGTYPGGVRTVNSSAAYNDGAWHHVVATLGANGMRLYVDGLPVASRSDVTSGQGFAGFWRIGGDNLNGWPNQPSSMYFDGDIDDVAIYPTVLPFQKVVDHWVAAGGISTVPAVPADEYGAAVRAAEPDLYWRLGESNGTTAADTGIFGNTGQYRSGTTLGLPGAIERVSDTAVGFDGASGLLSATASVTGPSVYSEELWFSTTTTNGGKLMGFGDSATGTSNNYDRHIIMENGGQLTFGVWTGQANTITSTDAYNDGGWHHMVATQSGDGMALYVDGVLVGTNPQTQAQAYTGYWRVGGDSSWGTQPWFAGTIDEVAVYPAALSPAVVAEHYAIGSATVPVNQVPVASFVSSVVGLVASVDAAGSSDSDGTVASYGWAFGDGSVGTGVAATHAYGVAGTYAVTLTVTDNQGAVGVVTRDVTVVPPVNQVPVASFVSSVAGLVASVDAAGSSDSDGTVASYGWGFGDGSVGSGVAATHAYAAAGTYAVTLTVTDNQGAVGAVTRDVTVTGPPPLGQLATDGFDRGVAAGWGLAGLGGAWGVAGSASYYRVADGAGVQVMPRAGWTLTSALGGVVSSDTEVGVTVSVAEAQTGGGTFLSVVGRQVGSATYAARLRLLASGAVVLQAMQGGSTLSSMTVPGLTYVPGEQLRVRMQVVGVSPTTVQAKVWKVGQAEPVSWQVSVTDATAALQAPGSIALSSYLSGSSTSVPTTVRWDDLTVTELA